MPRMLWAIALLVAGIAPLSPGAAQAGDPVPALAIHVSIAARRLWVLNGVGDTVLAAPVAVGSGRLLRDDTRSWTFRTPTGTARVSARESDPVWVPPDWYYIELAAQRHLRLVRLSPDSAFRLAGGEQLVVRGARVGRVGTDSVFHAFPPGDDVIVQGTLFIPPFGTEQRRMAGVLGRYRLRLTNGISLHGTPDEASIGKAVTHGCIRLRDADITWLYVNVPVGTTVIIR